MENNFNFDNPYEMPQNPENGAWQEPAGADAPEETAQSPFYGNPAQETNGTNYNYAPWSETVNRQTPPTPPKKKKKGWTAGKVIALALCCSLIGGIVGAGGTMLGSRLWWQDSPTGTSGSHIYEGQRPSTVLDVNHIDTSKVMTPSEVYAANVNSTVGITVGITTNYWGFQSTRAASGSGFILTADGYILTNFHVIEGGNTITVSLYDNTTYNADVIGYDESNDIAVLKVDAANLTPVVLGDSDNMNVGDTVMAIGNPLGELTFSLTVGAVSALDRTVTMSNGVTMDLIQTDCAINSGNSGGALFNLYGEVVGITNAKYSSSGSSSEASIDNIGFAIPINQVRKIVESIIEKGYIAKPYIGVSLQDVTEQMQSYGLPQGAAVASVTEGAPAQEGGLMVNDIITHANGQAITGSQDMVDLVGKCEKGDQLKLTVYRQGQTVELTITVGEQIQSLTGDTGGQQSSQTNPGNGNGNGNGNQGGSGFPWDFFFGY